jgi:DNA-3-methyladenine glycosylase I
MLLRNPKRCGWVNLKNQVYIDYHDNQWGVPLHDDMELFELLCLEGAQAGLSWETILNKKEAYKECFWNFDPYKIIKFSDEELLLRAKEYPVVQNRLKTLSIKKNALAYIKIKEEHGSLDKFLWSYVKNTPIINKWDNYRDAPTLTDMSTRISADLKKYGFGFVGPTICYAFMQACGMVSDHEVTCFRCNNNLKK